MREPNPFFEAEFVEAAVRHLPSRGVRLLVAEDASGWTGCLPVRRTPGPSALLRGWDHPYCFLSTPLLRDGAEVAAATALIAPLRGVADALMLRRVGRGTADAALATAAEALGLRRAWERTESRAAYRPDDDGSLPATAKRRKEIARRGRRLGEQLGAAVVSSETAVDAAALERFLALEASGWKGGGGSATAIASDPAHRRFFLELAHALARDGRLQLRSLSAGDTVVAMSCELRAGGVLFGFKSGYDERYARYAPGVQLLYDAAAHAQAAGDVTLIDSCSAADNALVNEILRERRELSSFVLTSARSAPVVRAGIAGALEIRGRATRVRGRAGRRRAPAGAPAGAREAA